jgi:hypothetical protein
MRIAVVNLLYFRKHIIILNVDIHMYFNTMQLHLNVAVLNLKYVFY